MANKLLKFGRQTVLKIVQISLKANYHLSCILSIFPITAFNLLWVRTVHWVPIKISQRHDYLKNLVFKIWSDYPIYGYLRTTVALRHLLNKTISEPIYLSINNRTRYTI